MRFQAPKKVLAGLREGDEVEGHPLSPDEVGRPPSLGDRIRAHTPPADFQFPFGTYEFALPPILDPFMHEVMTSCLKLEKTASCVPFTPVLGGYHNDTF
jgi:hypothetical protein